MNRTTTARPGYGTGFDALAATHDRAAFRRWWNGKGFFPVGGAEADALFSAPELHKAA